MLIKTIKPVLPVQTYRQKLRTGNTSRAARALAEVRLSPAFARRVTAEIESSYPRLALILQEIDLKKEMYWRCAQSTANPLSATYSLLPRSFYQSWGWDRSMPPKIHWL
ncbi:MAG TPA: hypothetical protein VHW69_10585, partial [Rhizomicrobium sp.]|nr:hypothetical protein [Rhizomicrobium sp.]